ncbi:uncharacterized protein LOC142335820 [Convolutriloba macropyga]|uniref:uncharacterized protein LOC142335820 n=1 Tax=Convolutriloba macropyga TaxID=536237 RepID=UPI003F51C7DF
MSSFVKINLHRFFFAVVTSITVYYMCSSYSSPTERSKMWRPFHQLSVDSKQTKSFLENFQWTNFSRDQIFVDSNCNSSLNMKQWLPPSVKAKICLLPLNRDKYVSKQIKYDGNWEYEIQTPLFRNVFPKFPKAAFIDIGGQLGIYSLSAAKLGRKVFTFEPLRETLMYLTTSVAINSLQNSIRVFPVALMDTRNQCLDIVVDKTNIGGSFVQLMDKRNQCLDIVVDKTNIGGSFVQLKENCTTNSTPVATLDDLLPIFTKLGLEEALIKMDCEGSEPRVILGGLNFLKTIRVPVIAMEFAGSKNIVQK